jgi:hypothetical protein
VEQRKVTTTRADIKTTARPLDAAAPAQAGEWVMVPREATEAMCLAGIEAADKEDLRWNELNSCDVWNAMLSAAPPAPRPATASPVVRHNDDGTLDEVVGTGEFHLEQMGPCHWWMQLGPHMVHLQSRGKIKAAFGENEARDPSPDVTSQPAAAGQPTAEHWRRAVSDFVLEQGVRLAANDWTHIEQRAVALAREEGK